MRIGAIAMPAIFALRDAESQAKT